MIPQKKPLETVPETAKPHEITLDDIINMTNNTPVKSTLERLLDIKPEQESLELNSLLTSLVNATENRLELIERKRNFMKQYKLTKVPSFIKDNFDATATIQEIIKLKKEPKFVPTSNFKPITDGETKGRRFVICGICHDKRCPLSHWVD